MNQKTLTKLEFDKINHILADNADSAGAKELCMNLIPSDSLSEIRQSQTETADALRRIYKKGGLSFGGTILGRGPFVWLRKGGAASGFL